MSMLDDISLIDYDEYQRNDIADPNMMISCFTNNNNSNDNTNNNNYLYHHDDTSIYIIEPIREEEDLLRQFTQWDHYVSNSYGFNTPKSSPQLIQGQGQFLIEQYKDNPHRDRYRSVRKFPSIKSKDFTSRREIHDNNNNNNINSNINYNHGNEIINTKEDDKNKNKKKQKKGINLLSHLIFHRGFLKRSNIKKIRTKLLLKKKGPKFRNKNEFNSYMNYIDLMSLINDEYKDNYEPNENPLMNDISDIIFPYKNKYRLTHFHEHSILPKGIALYKPANNNQIVVNKIIPRDIYLNRSYSKLLTNQFTQILNASKFRNSTVRRKLSKRKQTSNSLNKVRNRRRLGRSKTLPNNYRYDTTIPNRNNNNDNDNYNHNYSNNNNNDGVRETWAQYLQAVITQRIRLRLTLLKNQPPSSIISSTSSSIKSGSTQDRIKNY